MCFLMPAVADFLYLKAVFDFVDRKVLWQCLSLKRVPKKHTNYVYAFYSNTPIRVKNRQMVLQIVLPPSEFSEANHLRGDSLVDLEYTDDIVLFGEDSDKVRRLLTNIHGSKSTFGTRSTSFKLKMSLQE